MYGIVVLGVPIHSLAAGVGSLTLHAALISLLISPLRLPLRMVSDFPADDAQPLPLIATVNLLELDRSPDGIPVPGVQDTPTSLTAITLPSLPSLETMVTDAFEPAREAESGVEAAERERLQGVYLGQIHSRLARALEMITAEWPSAERPCEARVIQNEQGEVMDVDLEGCAFDERRRQVLEGAIRRASPLPAPPAGLALGSSLTLDLSRF